MATPAGVTGGEIAAETWVMETLKRGIKAVGVGKSGSKPIEDELAVELIKVIQASAAPPADWASELDEIRQRLSSFLGTLFVKVELSGGDLAVLEAVAAAAGDVTEPSDAVREGCSSSQILCVAVADGVGSDVLRALAKQLLNGKKLAQDQAFALGTAIFSDVEPPHLQVMCAHILRVRYETMDEWVGLIKAQQNTLVATAGGNEGQRAWRVVQLAEPFDGTHKAESFAPLLAWHIQDKWGLIAVQQMGASSGPKYGPNLYDLAHAISPDTILDTAALSESISAKARGEGAPRFGYFVDQAAVSPALLRWQSIRRNVLKRPFLATSEKFVDTHNARVVIASAFHPSFSDKMFSMVDLATEFDGCIIVRRGCEGSLGVSLARPAEFTCGVRQEDGRLKRMDFSFGPKDAGIAPRSETDQQPIKDIPAAEAAKITAEKMEWYADTGTSMDPIFDQRVAVTFKAFDVALEYVLNGRLVGPAAEQNDVESQGFDGVENSWGDSTSR